MSLNALLDLKLDPFEKITDEVLEEGGLYSNARTMNVDASADCELLLTDYLLNFGEENSRDAGYYDGCSSELEGLSDSENCSLASLKESLKKTKKSSGVSGKLPTGSGKNNERGKGVDSNVQGKKVSEKGYSQPNGKPIIAPEVRKERERMRCVNYRSQRTEKIKRLEKENVEMNESNKSLSDNNRVLNERISALEDQVEYLENVIANESALSTILNTLTEHSGLEFQRNSLQRNSRLNSLKRKREDNDDLQDENTTTVKKNNVSASPKTGGICLHLAPGRVSLEFCQECHKSSTRDENE